MSDEILATTIIDVYAGGWEGMWVYDLGIVAIGDNRTAVLFSAYDTENNYDSYDQVGWILTRSESNISVNGPFVLDTLFGWSEDAFYQKSHKPIMVGSEYIIRPVTTDIATEGSTLRALRVYLLKTDGASIWSLGYIDLDADDYYERSPRVIPVSDTLVAIAVTGGARVHLLDISGDAISHVGVHTYAPGQTDGEWDNFHFPIVYIARESQILIGWQEEGALNQQDPPDKPTRIIPVSYDVNESGINLSVDYGAMGDFDPTKHPAWLGWPASDDTYEFLGNSQLSSDVSVWSWAQTNYPESYGETSSYETPTAFASIAWDGSNVEVSNWVESEMIGRTGLFSYFITDIAVLSDNKFAITAMPQKGDPSSRHIFIFFVEDGLIVEEKMLASDYESTGALFGVPTLETNSHQSAGENGNTWILLQTWGKDENDDWYQALAALVYGEDAPEPIEPSSRPSQPSILWW